MRGHIRKRGSRWCVVVDVGYDGGGKRRQKWHSGFKRRKDAERALTEILGRLESGAYVEPAKLTYAEYLRRRWLPAREPSLRPTTYDGYARNVERHIIPALGAVRLQQLTPDALTAFYADRLRAPGRNGKPLSARTVRYLHSIVQSLSPTRCAGALSSATSPTPPSRRPTARPRRRRRRRGTPGSCARSWERHRGSAVCALAPLRDHGPAPRRSTRTGLARGRPRGGHAQHPGRARHGPRQDQQTKPKSARGLRAVALDAAPWRPARHRKRQVAERLGGPAYTDAASCSAGRMGRRLTRTGYPRGSRRSWLCSTCRG